MMHVDGILRGKQMGLERGPALCVGTIAANAGGMQVLLCIISIMHTSLIINRILSSW